MRGAVRREVWSRPGAAFVFASLIPLDRRDPEHSFGRAPGQRGPPMSDFFAKLLSADFLPHGHCYYWQPGIVWLHVISDGVIALAYYTIPIALIYFVRKRRDLVFNWMFVLFGVFIFACGTTHVMNIWEVWHGTYRLGGTVKLLTAAASIFTAGLFFFNDTATTEIYTLSLHDALPI